MFFFNCLLLISFNYALSSFADTEFKSDAKIKAETYVPFEIDPTLEEWVNSITGQRVDSGGEDKSTTSVEFENLDTTEKVYKLLMLKKEKSKHMTKAAEKLLDEYLVKMANKKVDIEHPLFTHILKDVLNNESTREKVDAGFYEALIIDAPKSCVQKDVILDRLSELDHLSDQQQKLFFIDKISKFESDSFRKKALYKLADSFTADEPSFLKAYLEGEVKRFTDFDKALPWQDPAKIATTQSELKKPDWHEEVNELLDKRGRSRCRKAKRMFYNNFPKDKELPVEHATLMAEKIEYCVKRFERQGNVERYWKHVQNLFQARYGTEGWAIAQLELAYYHWDRDQFEEATTTALSALKKVSGTHPQLKAEALLLLGYIADNESKAQMAANYLQQYVNEFPESEDYDEALKKLSLINIELAQWDLAINNLNALSDKQLAASVDERSDSTLGFALFWKSRVLLFKSKQKEAIKSLESLISVAYSTYYGAMGHFLLETITQKSYPIGSPQSEAFDKEHHFNLFSVEERTILKRVESLLRVGDLKAAHCELGEIDFAKNDGSYGRQIIEVLLLHASDRWLDAIVKLNGLPKSVKARLPRGFEKIIFPKRYEGLVEKYAKQVDLDPYLILALIRQESIFNAHARSPAGARGVMQLMHKTAIQLSKKAVRNKTYAQNHKLKLRRMVKNPRLLYNPEVNISLGTQYVRYLLDRFEKPVFVLASYNAGEGRFKKWIKEIPPADVLAFIERIPFNETRNYVKLVLRNYFYYKRIYEAKWAQYPHLDFLNQTQISSTADY